MAKTKKESRLGPDIPEITKALQDYQFSHPEARIKSYRQNSASIWVRIIDPSFRGMDRAERHDLIWNVLESLPEDTLSEIMILLLLTPEETKKSIANMDFEDPIPSNL
jgi:stress-induced morphogen